MLSRRRWLTLTATLFAERARGDDTPLSARLSARELPIPGAGRFGKKCLLLRPTRVPDGVALPLLVLFHGLGETSSEALGIRAWYDRYGLPEAYARLNAPPVVRTLPKQRYLSDERLLEINRELALSPFPDVALVCPFTPNVLGKDPSSPVLDRYGEYIEHALLPAVRAATPTLAGAAHLGVDGVSLGGYVALEVFSRKPELFGVLGSMQGAFGPSLADVYARRIAEASAKFGPRRVHVTTSSFDPFRDAAQRLAQRLRERGVESTFTLAEGPHDQTFLREAGTLELLLFQARALHGA
ncbi:MAG TPA: alpha/beta hydrolase-fold protein [Polyangiaceae bacterium]